MVQSISVLLQYKEYVEAFEANAEAREGLVRALLRAFDSRFWIPMSNILLRLCRGVGFGQQMRPDAADGGKNEPLSRRAGTAGTTGTTHATTTTGTASVRRSGAEPALFSETLDAETFPDASLASRRTAKDQPEGASALFQRRIVDACRGDPALCADFLDKLFNTLNWTITEFGVTLKEALDRRSRSPQHDSRRHRRKCSVMFELSVTLERVLEFLTKELPDVFLRSGSLNLHRLTESLVFVLGHTTVGPDAALFDQALLTRLAPSDKVSRAAILAPIAGILLNLDEAEARAADRAGSVTRTYDVDDGVRDRAEVLHEEMACVESIHAELAKGNCDIAQLEYVRDFPWSEHFYFPEDPPGDGEDGEGASDSDSSRTKATGRLARLRDFVRRVRTTREDVERAQETEDARSIPDEFIDPIMQTVMTDPVTLPGSGQVCDRTTIRRHLLGDRTDPFNRSPLDETMLVSADELRKKIEKWREEAPAVESLADID
jgi:Kip1 ubiquitination-promoting complex protein 1